MEMHVDDQSRQDGSEELLTLAQAVREGRGKVNYKQLWESIHSGRIEAYQPSGPNGKLLIPRGELERITRPVTPPTPPGAQR